MPLLFSYGTLQEEAVQRVVYGRTLDGEADALVGFELSEVVLVEGEFEPAGSGTAYPIVTHTGRPDARVPGTVYTLTDGELARSDTYEPPPYERVATTLASGRRAWVYAHDGSSAPDRFHP